MGLCEAGLRRYLPVSRPCRREGVRLQDDCRPLVRVVPDIARLCRDVLADRGAPVSTRIANGGLLVYPVNPVDLIPEFIPVLGPRNGVVVAVLVLRYVRGRLPTDGLRERWRGTPEGFGFLHRVMG